MLRTFVVAALVGACASGSGMKDTDTTRTSPASAVSDSVRVIAQLQQSGWDTPTTLVIDDAAAFGAAWATAHSGMTPVPPVPAVDFARERVVIVAAGMRSSGGHVVSLVIAPAAAPMMLDATIQRPGEGCSSTAQITQPAIVAAVRRTPESPRVVVTERAGPPC